MASREIDETITFSLDKKQSNEEMAKEAEMKQTLETVYRSLSVKGYNPVNQIVWYILTEDPTYITNYNNARSLIRKIDRDELLNALVRNYLGLTQ